MTIEKQLSKIIKKKLLTKYKKTHKLKKITTSTLLPFAILLGNKEFEKAIKQKNTQTNSQSNTFEEFIQKSGLTPIELKPNTLLPAGILLSMITAYDNISTIKKDKGHYSNLQNYVLNKITKQQLSVFQKFIKKENDLCSSSLLPICTLFGKDIFQDYIIDDIKENSCITKWGNTMLPKKLPFIKDQLLQDYLLSINHKSNEIPMNQPVPLGLLYALDKLYL
tara:strand:- start:501 stop:1166 length:666 start_codon:yes stop_codon:yes gene_type:complete